MNNNISYNDSTQQSRRRSKINNDQIRLSLFEIDTLSNNCIEKLIIQLLTDLSHIDLNNFNDIEINKIVNNEWYHLNYQLIDGKINSNNLDYLNDIVNKKNQFFFQIKKNLIFFLYFLNTNSYIFTLLNNCFNNKKLTLCYKLKTIFSSMFNPSIEEKINIMINPKIQEYFNEYMKDKVIQIKNIDNENQNNIKTINSEYIKTQIEKLNLLKTKLELANKPKKIILIVFIFYKILFLTNVVFFIYFLIKTIIGLYDNSYTNNIFNSFYSNDYVKLIFNDFNMVLLLFLLLFVIDNIYIRINKILDNKHYINYLKKEVYNDPNFEKYNSLTIDNINEKIISETQKKIKFSTYENISNFFNIFISKIFLIITKL